jgi:hypothetical protein
MENYGRVLNKDQSSGPLLTGIPGERFLLAGVEGQVFVAGVVDH